MAPKTLCMCCVSNPVTCAATAGLLLLLLLPLLQGLGQSLDFCEQMGCRLRHWSPSKRKASSPLILPFRCSEFLLQLALLSLLLLLLCC